MNDLRRNWRNGMTVGERVWLMGWSGFTALAMVYNLVTNGNVFG